jgi:hypothetical protein
VIALLVVVFVLGIFCGVFVMGLASMAGKSDRHGAFCSDCIWGPKGPGGDAMA